MIDVTLFNHVVNASTSCMHAIQLDAQQDATLYMYTALQCLAMFSTLHMHYTH